MLVQEHVQTAREFLEAAAEEYDAPILRAEFGMAEMLHANFYHGFMEDYQLNNTRELARDFVTQVLALLG
jgi:hypothetical protein